MWEAQLKAQLLVGVFAPGNESVFSLTQKDLAACARIDSRLDAYPGDQLLNKLRASILG
jgi:hypothetical protein